jgi:hypothetical protein
MLELAHAAGHIADHVTYPGLGSPKDRELVKLSVERDYAFVTNNRSDFLTLYRRTPLHAGLVIIVPNVRPALQRQLFETALGLISERDLVNTVMAPGPTQTHMYDQLPQSRRDEVIHAVYSGRICQPKEVAAAILLARERLPRIREHHDTRRE